MPQADLRQQITETPAKPGFEVTSRLRTSAPASVLNAPPGPGAPQPVDPAAMQAASELPAEQRQAMIDGMAEGLATKLKANPRDTDIWPAMHEGELSAARFYAANGTCVGDSDRSINRSPWLKNDRLAGTTQPPAPLDFS